MRKWTIVDTIIVAVVAFVAIIGAVILTGGSSGNGVKSKVDFTVLADSKELGFSNAIKPGDEVVINLSTEDKAVVKKVEAAPSKILTFNSNDGIYSNRENDKKEDVFITLEADADEDDISIVTGETIIRVGAYTVVKGKGYATEGHIVEIKAGGEDSEQK